MKPGEWYKVFGEPQQTRYYHVLSVNEDSVQVEAYAYHHVQQRVVATSHYRLSAKEWMEHEAENAIHPVPRRQVPFLLDV